MFIATVETRSFSFIALGETEAQAKTAILNGWRRHCRKTGAIIDHVTEEDINVNECQPGQCLRDHSLI